LYQVAMNRRLTPAGYGRLSANPIYRAMSRGLTFTWFSFTLLWFWATWPQISALAEKLGTAGSIVTIAGTVGSASLALAIPDMFGAVRDSAGSAIRSRYTRTAFAAAMILAMAVAGLVLNMSSPEIVYKQF